MTWEERVKRVAGSDSRSGRPPSWSTVMFHAGVCLGRHYCAFARIACGQMLVDFFEADRAAMRHRSPVAAARLASTTPQPTLYDAIEQRDNRHRKPMAIGRALERLMVLDHVITHREFRWLGSEQDKVAHFLTQRPLTGMRSRVWRSA